MVNIREIFTDRLQAASKTSGVSQSEISRRLKVSRNTVNLWFNGKSWPEPETIDQIAKIMRVTPTWLMGGGDGPITIPEALEVLNANAGLLAKQDPLIEKISRVKGRHHRMILEDMIDTFLKGIGEVSQDKQEDESADN